MRLPEPATPAVASVLLGVFFLTTQACRSAQGNEDPPMPLRLTSASFTHESEIPQKHTCEGEDRSPPLAWTDAPAGAKSFALTIDDPDAPDPRAPKTRWVHWVVYDIPADVSQLSEGVTAATLPRGAREGKNGWNATGYRGPCPPIGRHRYFHKLYALDVVLPDLGSPDEAALERAMEGHVLAQATLMGSYQKKK